MERKHEQGITLIALVVTIVVLLILAGISIAMLTGENGVISQARNAKEATEQAKVEELVSVAIGSVISKNNGSTAGITPKMIADQINEDERRSDVYAEDETTFPTNIIFPKEKRKAEANLNAGKFVANEDSIYNTDVNEADIAPGDLFDYEIINDGTTGALTLDSLPTKTVRITRIKPEYCNHYGYNPDTENWDYTDTNYEIIYKGTNISKTLIIPYQVDGKYIPNGIEGEYYKVTEVSLVIDEKHHNGNTATTSIPNVEELIYPNTVKEILSFSAKCSETNKLKTVVLSNNIVGIPSQFFYNSKIENIVIPDNVIYIGVDAFYGCTNLRNVTIGNGIQDLSCIDFSKCKDLTSITIGDGIKAIPKGIFANCDKLTSLTIGDGISTIENGTFNSKMKLTSLILGKNVTGLNWLNLNMHNYLTTIKVSEENKKYDSRNDCNAIIEKDTNTLLLSSNETVIPESVTSIGTSAFGGCINIKNITIPESVTSIGAFAFGNCSSLKSIIIPKNLTSIEVGTFSGCENLKSITISENITSIGYGAFFGCSGLTSIKVSEKNSKYDSRNNCNAIIETDTNTLIQGCSTTIIPNDITTIGGNAFSSCCENLESITIPNNITSIAAYAFDGCDNLTTINYTGTQEEWNKITIEEDGNDILKSDTVTINYNCK